MIDIDKKINRLYVILIRKKQKFIVKRMLFLLAWGLCMSKNLIAQPVGLFFHHLNTANGLSQSFNSFIYRDSKGFAWLSSMDGLNRFDGQAVRIYRPKSGQKNTMLGNNVQGAFFEDEQSNLWMCTYHGINCYRRKSDDFVSYRILDKDGKLLEENYYMLFRNPEGKMWVIAGDNLFSVSTPDPEDSTAKPKQHYFGPLIGVRCFPDIDTARGELTAVFSCFFKKKNGFDEYAVKGERLELTHSWLNGLDGQDSAKVFQVLKEGNNMLWVASDIGLIQLNRRDKTVYKIHRYFHSMDVGVVRGIASLSQDKLFVTSDRGLFLFDKHIGDFIKYFEHKEDDPNSLASNNLNEIFLDQDRVLWIAIWAKGVDFAHIDKVKFSFVDPNYALGPGQSRFVTGAMAEDTDAKIWCGSNMAGLKWINNQLLWDNTIPQPGPNYHARQIYTLKNGDLLLCSYYDRAFWYQTYQKKYIEIRTSDNLTEKFEDFYQLHSNKIIATSYNGIYELTLNGSKAVAYPISVPGLNLSGLKKIFEDSDKRIFIGKGLRSVLILENKKNRFSFVDEIPVVGEAKAFWSDGETVWIGGEFGLLKIKKRDLSWTLIDEKDGLPNKIIYGILPGKNGDLWLSSNAGILCFKPDSRVFRKYSIADGLQDFEFNTNSYLKASDGRLWFGGIKGYNVFDPAEIHDVKTIPQVHIIGLKVNDEEFITPENIILTESIQLEHDQNTLSFDFVALEFSDPANNKLKYRLDHANGNPYDQDWVLCKDARGFARYAKLPPGEYVLKIKGANSDGVWNEKPRQLFIKIYPPFWQTWWFISLMALLALAIGVLVVRAYINNKLKFQALQLREQQHQIEKQEALTQERNRIAAEMHDDLGGGLTSIRVLSERVQNKIDDPNLRKSVDKITAYSHELVLKMSEIIWAMNSNFDTLDNLIAYIRNYAVRYLDENGIRCIVHRPDEVPELVITGERRRNLYLAVKESLHNIVKHAGAERVNIDFELNGKLEIRVQDNGKGIDPEQINQFGNGLSNMRKRLESIGGSMEVLNREGTLLIFTVPVQPD